jgi:hypothetical protein
MFTSVSNKYVSMPVHPCFTTVFISEQHTTTGVGVDNICEIVAVTFVVLQSEVDAVTLVLLEPGVVVEFDAAGILIRHIFMTMVLQSASDVHSPALGDTVETAKFLQKGTAKGTGMEESAGKEDPVELGSSPPLWRNIWQ